MVGHCCPDLQHLCILHLQSPTLLAHTEFLITSFCKCIHTQEVFDSFPSGKGAQEVLDSFPSGKGAPFSCFFPVVLNMLMFCREG
eukprot:c23550_g1_i7 orf=856-1110(+)